MSIDYNAVLVRGFAPDAETLKNLSDDFKDEWAIYFNSWSSSNPIILGYYLISPVEEGFPVPITDDLINGTLFPSTLARDEEFMEACRNAGIKLHPVQTFFGVTVT